MNKKSRTPESRAAYSKKCLETKCNYHVHSPAERKRIADVGRNMWTPEQRQKHSNIMKKVARNKPESYMGIKSNRVKLIEYGGEKLNGSWELLFAQWCDSNDVKWERCKSGLNMSGKENELTIQIFIFQN